MYPKFFLFTALLFSQLLSAQCPIIFDLSNQDLHVCEMENFIFTAQFDDESLATVNWTLPNGTVESTFALGQFFDSSTGCNEVLTYSYEVLCEDGSLLEEGSFTVTVYTFNEAIVDVEECSHTVLADCPEDVEIITNGEIGNVYVGEPGTEGAVLVEIRNTGAPEDCSDNIFLYNFDCTAVIPSGIETISSVNLARVQGRNEIEFLADLQFETAMLVDLSGRTLWEAHKGNTSSNRFISISQNHSGIGILVLQTSDAIYSQKLFLQ